MILLGQDISSIYVLYSYVIEMLTVWTSIALVLIQGLAVPLVICYVLLLRVSKQIRQIDDILLDPSMLPADEKLITIMLVTGLVLTVIGTIFGLAALGLIRL